MNKLTAEKFLKKKKYPSFNNSGGLGKYYVEEAMIEFAKLHVKAALEAAAEKAKSNCGYREDEWGMNRAMFHRVDKDSILLAYPEELIK